MCVMVVSSRAFLDLLNDFRRVDNDLDFCPFSNGVFGWGLYATNLVR
jgi:hypothetical protein